MGGFDLFKPETWTKGPGELVGFLTGNSQNPGALGTGQYVAPTYPIDTAGITGNPTYGAASDYGLNDIWARLSAALGNAGNVQTPTVNAAQIGTAGDASMLGQQQGLASMLEAQASGRGLSPADLMLRQGEQGQVAGQLALLGSGGAGNPALAMRSAVDAAGAGNATLNQQLGLQRAQETLNAQNALGSVLGQARGQSQAYNTAQAGMRQQAGLANQNASLQQEGIYNQQLMNLLGAMAGIGQSNRAAVLGANQLGVQQNLGLAGVNSQAYTNAAQANANLVKSLMGMFGAGGASSAAGGLGGGGGAGAAGLGGGGASAGAGSAIGGGAGFSGAGAAALLA